MGVERVPCPIRPGTRSNRKGLHRRGREESDTGKKTTWPTQQKQREAAGGGAREGCYSACSGVGGRDHQPRDASGEASEDGKDKEMDSTSEGSADQLHLDFDPEKLILDS